MINKVILEGIVAREPWAYDKYAFFCIASYRDMVMPALPHPTELPITTGSVPG
jgi:hypothetical protein